MLKKSKIRTIFQAKKEKETPSIFLIKWPIIISFFILILISFNFYSCLSLEKTSLSIINTKKIPNIILIINDALRSDCLGYNGAHDISTPNLDLFASRCINFKNAISQAGHTNPSIPSILSGLYPNRHNLFNRHRRNELKKDIIMLPEYLCSLGYHSAAFVYENLVPYVGDFIEISVSCDWKGKETIDQVIQFLNNNKYSQYFILLHIFDPHGPYVPNEILNIQEKYLEKYKERLSKSDFEMFIESQKNIGKLPPNIRTSEIEFLLYKKEIEDIDKQYGRLFNYLFNCSDQIFDKKKDIIFFTADHGEEFPHENGYYHHGRSPYIETMKVPLLLYSFGKTPITISRYVENSSIFPTILDLLGFDQEYIKSLNLSTSSLMRFITVPENLENKSYALSEAIFLDSDLKKFLPEALDCHESKSIIRSDGYKLIYDTTTKESRLFNLELDPEEKNDLLRLKINRFRQIAEELFLELKKRTNLLYDYRQLSEIK